MKFINSTLLALLASLQIGIEAHATIVIPHEVGQKVQGVIEVSRQNLFGDKKINIPLPAGVWNVQTKQVENSTGPSPIEGVRIILDQTESGKMISGMWLSIYPHDRRNWNPGNDTCKGRFLSKERGSSINGYCHSLKDIPLLTNAKNPTQIKIREDFRSRGLDWPARALQYSSAFEASPDFAIYMHYTISLPAIGLEDSLTTLSSSIDKTEEWWRNNSSSGSVKSVKEWFEAYAEEIFLMAQGKVSTNPPILKESVINKLSLAVTDLKVALPELNNKIVQEVPASFVQPRVVNSTTQAKVEKPDGVPATTSSIFSLSASSTSPDKDGLITLNINTNSDTVSLTINGEEIGGRIDGRYSIKRLAQIGLNKFELIATDQHGNTSKQTISVSRQVTDSTIRFASLNPIAVRARPATNAVAIIIGIQDYGRVPKAEFASNDARAFYDYAVRGLGVRPDNIKILLDQEASDIGILSAFKNWLPLKTRKGQTDVYVFFSGHGLPSDDGSNLYMLPHGVDRQFLDRTAIKQSELIASLQAVSPRSVTMFMDACYSGQIRTGETLLASARPISIQTKASSFPANFNVISASAPDQLASSSPDLKHGVFSYFLMKGMEGEADENKDGNITMAEMQSYLKEYVGKKAMSLNRTQVPQLTGDQSKVLVSR
jgi:hypothetical protein